MWNPLVHLVSVLSLEHGISETSGKHKYLCYDGANSTATSASRMHLLPKQVLRRAAQEWTGRPTGEREEKCIIEDVPSDTLVIGNYKVQSWDIREQDFLESAPGLGMFVTVTSPSAEVILSKLYGPQGTFSFTSYLSGEYIICFQSNYTRLVSFPGSRLRIHLDIRVGEHFLDESVLQAKDKVNEVNMRLEHLIEQIHHVSKEQNYEREREEKFRKTSEETNSNILWWAIVQTIILISVGIWQIKSLRDFLISKKLV